VAEVLAYVFQLRALQQGRRPVSGSPDQAAGAAGAGPAEPASQVKPDTNNGATFDEQFETACLDERPRRQPRGKRLAAPILIILLLAMMILPLPAFVLDLFFSFNIALS
jgi:hypothetical protein